VSNGPLACRVAAVFLAENSACANEMAGEFLGAKIFSVACRPRRVVPVAT